MFLQDKDKLNSLLAEIRSSAYFTDFLLWYLSNIVKDNVFSEGYGESRAFSDGKADQALELINLLKEIAHDR